MIAACMHDGNAWCDASILNISSRGLLLRTTNPPLGGAYVDVRRGNHVIVGRVIWANAHQFGVRTQDKLAIDSLVGNNSPNSLSVNDREEPPVERWARSRPERLEWRHAQSRERGRALQFACIAGFGFILATCAYEAVRETLSRPLTEVSMHLGAAP